MTFTEVMDRVALAFEVVVAVELVVGLGWSVVLGVIVWRRTRNGPATYQALRQSFGNAVLLGLELLVAADLVRTLAVQPTLDQLAALGLLVLIRTFLSFALETEIHGVAPWRRWQVSGATRMAEAHDRALGPREAAARAAPRRRRLRPPSTAPRGAPRAARSSVLRPHPPKSSPPLPPPVHPGLPQLGSDHRPAEHHDAEPDEPGQQHEDDADRAVAVVVVADRGREGQLGTGTQRIEPHRDRDRAGQQRAPAHPSAQEHVLGPPRPEEDRRRQQHQQHPRATRERVALQDRRPPAPTWPGRRAGRRATAAGARRHASRAMAGATRAGSPSAGPWARRTPTAP